MLEGSGAIKDFFKKVIKRQELSHAYIFEGKAASGKLDMAIWIAQALFCEDIQTNGEPCQSCLNCKRILSRNHPDVLIVEPEGASIKVDQVRQVREMMTMSGMEGQQKVYIINQAEKMTLNAANSLLKFFEEPNEGTYVFLLTEAKNRLLPTILSRAQVISFRPLPSQVREDQLVERGIPREKARVLSKLSQDNEEAMLYYEGQDYQELIPKLNAFIQMLLAKNPDSFVYITTDLAPFLSDRDLQEFTFNYILRYLDSLLQNYYQEPTDLAISRLVSLLKAVMQAQTMFQANVSWQNSLEFLALQSLKD